MTCKLTAKQCKQLVALADKHRDADEYIAGVYEKKDGTKWIGGCAIGCTIRDAQSLGILPGDVSACNHDSLAKATGVKITLAVSDALLIAEYARRTMTTKGTERCR